MQGQQKSYLRVTIKTISYSGETNGTLTRTYYLTIKTISYSGETNGNVVGGSPSGLGRFLPSFYFGGSPGELFHTGNDTSTLKEWIRKFTGGLAYQLRITF